VSNPRATTTTARQRDVLVHALAAEAKLEVEETNNRGHAAALACRAMRDGVDTVIALGGDGTVNEVVNGLLTDGVHPDVPALGVVPGGSTNVFARALGLPNDPVEATSMLLDAMAAERTRDIGLGMADDRYFLFTAGLGFDAAVVGAVEAHRRRGKTSTHSLYVRTAVSTFFRQDRRHPKLSLELPDGSVVEDLYLALVNNTSPWTYLGNNEVTPTPAASFDTGLDVYARTRMGTVGLLYSVARMISRSPNDDGSVAHPGIGGPAGQAPAPARRRRLGRGSRARSADPGLSRRTPGARVEHDLSRFALIAEEPLPFQVDGDALDARKRIEFCAVPNALRVLI
jgi:diacylglycerol kinase family enzyme